MADLVREMRGTESMAPEEATRLGYRSVEEWLPFTGRSSIGGCSTLLKEWHRKGRLDRVLIINGSSGTRPFWYKPRSA